jgi:hypothetical protein
VSRQENFSTPLITRARALLFFLLSSTSCFRPIFLYKNQRITIKKATFLGKKATFLGNIVFS